jgi:hypothetical protein
MLDARAAFGVLVSQHSPRPPQQQLSNAAMLNAAPSSLPFLFGTSNSSHVCALACFMELLANREKNKKTQEKFSLSDFAASAQVRPESMQHFLYF